MNIIPAIDLINGQCVRLQQGQFDCVTEYKHDPLELALHYQQQGAQRLHIVDLDGAKDPQRHQAALIMRIQQQCQLKVQVGGGIRDHDRIDTYLQNGVDRIVIGSLAITQPDLVNQWFTQYGHERIVLALDVSMQHGQPLLMNNAWQDDTGLCLWDCLAHYPDCRHVLCTDISCDGMMQGPNLALYHQAIERFPTIAWQASGGIGHPAHVAELSALGVSAAIIGKALYENTIRIGEPC